MFYEEETCVAQKQREKTAHACLRQSTLPVAAEAGENCSKDRSHKQQGECD